MEKDKKALFLKALSYMIEHADELLTEEYEDQWNWENIFLRFRLPDSLINEFANSSDYHRKLCNHSFLFRLNSQTITTS